MQNDLKPDNAPKDLLDWLGLTDTPNWTRGRALGTVVSILLTLLFAMALAAAFTLLGRTLLPSPDPAGGNLGTGALIVALLGAPFLIWNTVIKHRALGFQKEGHLTDRISKAVEQLGAEKTVKEQLVNSAGKKVFRKGDDGSHDFSQPVTIERTLPNIEVRIGGILSLERIAQDSTSYDKGRDHVRVMEILCAYIRENAPASGAQISLRQDWCREKDIWDGDPDHFEESFCGEYKISQPDRGDATSVESLRNWAKSLPPPRADIAISLQVIGRRDAKQRQVEARWGKGAVAISEWVFGRKCPRLSQIQDGDNYTSIAVTAFRREMAEWLNLLGAYRGYKLDLRATNLQAADLSGLDFSAALLDRACLDGANLEKCRMVAAELKFASLQAATLVNATFGRANFRSANMDAGNLMGAEFQRAYFHSASLVGADLCKANMADANLTCARFDEARILETQFYENPGFISVRTNRSYIRLTNFADLEYTAEQIEAAFGDASVFLADKKSIGLDMPAHWPKFKLDADTFEIEWYKWRESPSTYIPPPPPT